MQHHKEKLVADNRDENGQIDRQAMITQTDKMNKTLANKDTIPVSWPGTQIQAGEPLRFCPVWNTDSWILPHLEQIPSLSQLRAGVRVQAGNSWN